MYDVNKFFVGAFFAFSSVAFANSDILFEDFESGSYLPKWEVEGEAFGSAPARGGFPYQMKVGDYNGDFLVNSYYKKDETTGGIRSKPFKIERKFLKCLIAGGNQPQSLYLRVLADGKEVARITGINSEFLTPKAIDLSNYLGKTGVIEIVDKATGGWGHINIDDIIFTDELPDCPLGEAQIEIKKAQKYLCIPVNKNAPRRRLQIASSKGILLNANMNLDFVNPEKIVYLSTREHCGENLQIFLPQVFGEKVEIKMSQKFIAKDFPNEMLRPQYHFSSPQGWLNDPNGMVYWNGKWHMYYQAIPYQVSDKDGHKYWGHAVSDDLINWQTLPVAIAPYFNENGGVHAIWSGAGFADVKNRSGFFDKKGGLIFAYTFTGKGDYVAYSKDGKFPKRLDTPITTAKGRDPCIFYHEPSKKWVVLRYEEVRSEELKKDLRKFVFYSSKDLKEWTRGQVLDDFYECPYIVSMPVNNDKSNVKYLIFDASGECVIGDFDGDKFTPLSDKRCPKFVYGDAYAGQIFNNAPDGRTVNISWLRQPHEDFLKTNMPFADMMTLPMDLRLEHVDGKYRVYASVSREIEKYYGTLMLKIDSPKTLAKDEIIELRDLSSAYVIEGEFDVSNAENFQLKILGAMDMSYDKKANLYRLSSLRESERTFKTKDLRWRGGPTLNLADKIENGRVKFKIFVDRSSVELFHDDKQVLAIYAPFGDEKQHLQILGENLRIENLTIREIKKVFSQKNLKAL